MNIFRRTVTTCLRNTVLTKQCEAVVKSNGYHRWVAPTLRELKRREARATVKTEDKRSTYLEWNYDAEIYAFGERLGEKFNRAAIRQALTDRSYAIQQEMKLGEDANIPDNREMIETGDKLIRDRIRKHLKEQNSAEEIIKSVTQHLMSIEMLSLAASNIGLRDLILTVEHPESADTLSNAFKAVVAALHESHSDTNITDRFINDFLLAQLSQKDLYETWEPEDPLSLVSSMADARGLGPVEPRLCNQSAMNTILANYQVGMYSKQKTLLGLGWGESVDIAKKHAAFDAIRNLHASDASR